MISDARSFLDYELFADAVDVNESGVAVALWGENITASRMHRLWGNVYRAGAWSTPTVLGDPGSGDGSVSVMPNGDAMVVYVQSQHVQAQRYLAASDSWTSSAPISADSPAGTFPISPGVVTDGLGNAIAVWSQGNQVWARRYDASAGWSATVVQLSASPRTVSSPKIVVDGNHRFTAVWVEDTAPFDPSLPGGGPNKPTAHARRYVADWEPDRRIGWADTDLPGQFDSAGRIWIDANSAGSVFVVWEQSRTLPDNSIQRSIDAAHFDPVPGAWSPPETIASHNANLSFPQVAVDSSGRALAGWIRTRRAGPGPTSSPCGARGSTPRAGRGGRRSCSTRRAPAKSPIPRSRSTVPAMPSLRGTSPARARSNAGSAPARGARGTSSRRARTTSGST